jgi:SAM-dependent methyltransferase
VHVVVGDLSRAPLPAGAFDLVFCRFVFEYLADPLFALRELVRLTRKGGKVVVVDLDGNGVFHYPLPASVESRLARLQGALAGRLDPFIGRKLYSLFQTAGLGEIAVHASPHHLHAGRASEAALANWRYKLRTLAPAGAAALGGAEEYRSFEREFLNMLTDEGSLTYSVLFLVGGTKQ